MAKIIRFTTDLFDISKEDENPINPIYGQSLLLWLANKIPNVYNFTTPDYEDWGWYSDINWEGRTYIIGSSCLEEENSNYEWGLQIIKQRSLFEKIFNKEKMTEEDKCFLYFKKLIESEPNFKNIEVE